MRAGDRRASLEDGRVRQHIQISTDDGTSWDEGWVGYYVRKG